MSLAISYMGTKRQLAPIVADVISCAPDGPLLDLFSGLCCVGSAVAPKRQVWCNDAQIFASTVAEAFFASSAARIPRQHALDLIFPLFHKNLSRLQERFSKELNRESKALACRDLQALEVANQLMPDVRGSQTLDLERHRLHRNPRVFPCRLFSITFSGSYFSLKQCAEIDSIKYAINFAHHSGYVDGDQKRWMNLALCQAISKVAATTGHFAQHLKLKQSNAQRIFAQKSRSVWSEWLAALDQCEPVGTVQWRKHNKVFNGDALQVLSKIAKLRTKPAVIYADPPYTSDHYSRYYHILDTLILYDYPTACGVGRYRPDRFSSDFSIKTRVPQAISELITRTADIGASLVLSYPDHGLLPDAKSSILRLLKLNYRKIRRPKTIDHHHSSLGASKGVESNAVTEVIYYASN